MDFCAIDVETANADMSSICQIGIAEFRDGKLFDTWKTYINPDDDFDEVNIMIHGITPEMVQGYPNFKQVHEHLYKYLSKKIVVCHTHFDRSAIHQAAHWHDTTLPDCEWLDSAKIARRAWLELSQNGGYGLANIAKFIGYKFKHHDALEDACASGHIVLKAIEATGVPLEDWLIRSKKPLHLNSLTQHEVKRIGNQDGLLFGEVLVFTGSLIMPRAQAADIASQIGCQVDAGVTKKTTLLVVGDQDIKALAGKEKSAKHIKAEELIKKGQNIRILIETDFLSLIKMT